MVSGKGCGRKIGSAMRAVTLFAGLGSGGAYLLFKWKGREAILPPRISAPASVNRYMLLRLTNEYLLRMAVIILIGVILFGNATAEDVVRWLAIFIGIRLIGLGIEAWRAWSPKNPWSERASTLEKKYGDMSSAERAAYAAAYGLNEDATASDLAQAEIAQIRENAIPLRSGLEIMAEAIALPTFGLLIPLDVGLATEPFFSLNRPLEAPAIIVLVTSIVLYGLPHFRFFLFRRGSIRTLWWSAPFFPVSLMLALLVSIKHPYLNPFDSAHHRLAAERVITLMRVNNVIAASHVDWIYRYARDLEAQGQCAKAIELYQMCLQLDVNRDDIRQHLTQLASHSGEVAAAAPLEPPAPDAYAPLWPEGFTFPEVPTCRLNESLEAVPHGTVVLVPVESVPDVVLASVAYAIQHELGLPVMVANDSVPLIKATRIHGLVVGEQWNVDELQRAFIGAYPALPSARLKYVLLTRNDIYQDGTNFVFSASYPWGAIVSAARFIAMGSSNEELLERTAKQTLCALLKSFGLPASPDRECVTSYVRSLDEFERKGNRPDSQTLALFHKARAEWETDTHTAENDAATMDAIHQELDQLSAPGH
jgi:hypothetical protein